MSVPRIPNLALLPESRRLAHRPCPLCHPRVTIIGSDVQVFAESQSDSQTMENHAGRPEVREALAKGSGRAIRHSVTLNRDLLYYAVRHDLATGPPIIMRFALPIETVDEVLQSFRRSQWLSSFLILLI